MEQRSEVDRQSKIRGCLLGGAIGDALGAPVEFMSLSEIKSRFGPEGIAEYSAAYGRVGAITDDTQMTLFSAEGLLRGYVDSKLKGVGSIPEAISHAYLRWLLTQGFVPKDKTLRVSKDGLLWREKSLHSRRAPGNTCISALMQVRGFSTAKADNDSKGAGAIMRVMPIACFAASGDESSAAEVFELGKQISWVTHGHPSGYLSAAAFSVIVHALLWGMSLETGIQRASFLLRREEGSDESLTAIDKALRCVEERIEPELAISALGEAWVGEEALAVALYCTLISRDFSSGVRMAVNHDGDSDTTGSLVGQLLGAIHGEAAIPARWLSDLESRDTICLIADDLAEFHAWNFGDDVHLAGLRERYPAS